MQVFRYGMTDTAAFATVTPTALPPPLRLHRTRKCVKDAMNVRSGPGPRTPSSAARQGRRLRRHRPDGARTWWQIDYQGQIGWVYARWWTPSPSTASPPPRCSAHACAAAHHATHADACAAHTRADALFPVSAGKHRDL
ncbi:MAG: hypothetical protein R2856_17270 [Caldilineaceae bacterium]